MNSPLPGGWEYPLSLADGCCWFFAAANAEAGPIVSRLGDVMRLRGRSPAASPPPGIVRRLLVSVDSHSEASPFSFETKLPSEAEGTVRCVLPLSGLDDQLYLQLMQLSGVIAREAQVRGGILLHGALAERDGVGVVLAAPGGTGKTTASGRLPVPWRSLCDDTTLVVRDPRGNYMAHPWPTWSRFLWGGSGGRWNVQHAVPLGGIFLLSRAVEDRGEPVGAGQAVSLLVQSAQQASQLMSRGLGREENRAMQLERFNNLCDLARVVPAHLLHISLTGVFWKEIERALEVKTTRI